MGCNFCPSEPESGESGVVADARPDARTDDGRYTSLASGQHAWPAPITEIGKKAWLFGKLQPGGARKRINAT